MRSSTLKGSLENLAALPIVEDAVQSYFKTSLCGLTQLSRPFAAMPRTHEEDSDTELDWDSRGGPSGEVKRSDYHEREPAPDHRLSHTYRRDAFHRGRPEVSEASTSGRDPGAFSGTRAAVNRDKNRIHRWAVSGRSQMNREESSRQPRDSFQKQTDPSLGRHQTQRDNKPLRAYPGHVRREPSLPRPAAQNAPRSLPPPDPAKTPARHRWLAKTPLDKQIGSTPPMSGLQQAAQQSREKTKPDVVLRIDRAPPQPTTLPDETHLRPEPELRVQPPSSLTRQEPRPKPQPRPQAKPVVTEIELKDDVTIRQLAQQLDVEPAQVEQSLLDLGERPSSLEDLLTPENAELAAMSFGKTVTFSQAYQDRSNDALPRPPVVTIMGHVDHGKTTLLDALRKTSVAAGEAGGITQSIGAFQVAMPDSDSLITFLDTPGHAAFTAMRARGAAVTDVIVLVVAADDGVKPQTLEALQLAQASTCPIVVALTKCDRPGADPQRAKQQLAKEGLELEEFGGTVQVIETAAPLGKGLVQLEEALLFQAELMSLQASRTRPAVGAVVEARIDRGQGAMATVIVKRGTLKVGQNVVVGSEYGKVRALKSAGGQTLEQVFPGIPVEVSGLRGMPQAGDDFLVQPSEELARKLATARAERKQLNELLATDHTAGDPSDSSQEEGAVTSDDKETKPQLVIIVKADTQGSAEAVCASLEGMASSVVDVKAVPAGLGPISTADVDMAVGMGATVLGFNVKNSNSAVVSRAKQKGVAVLRQNVIYHMIQEVAGIMAGLAPQIREETTQGEARILQLFPTKERQGSERVVVAGCRVDSGSIKHGEQFRVLRGEEVVWTGICRSMKRHKLEVRQVGKNTECGIILDGFSGFVEGDTLQCFSITSRPQSPEGVANLRYASKEQ